MQCLQKHNVVISLSCDMDLPIFCGEDMLYDMKCVLFATMIFRAKLFNEQLLYSTSFLAQKQHHKVM
jgi:hypothetical protein